LPQPFWQKGCPPAQFQADFLPLLSIPSSVRANHSAFVQSASFSRPATSFPKEVFVFVRGRFPVQYPTLNSRPKVAGAFRLWRGLYFEIQEQKQKQIGRIYLFRFPSSQAVFLPNPHAKKIFEAERKFICPVSLGEYRVRDILLIYSFWCSGNKYNRECCRSFAF
jgi:hypothetical protein